jgi:hypothetical protein
LIHRQILSLTARQAPPAPERLPQYYGCVGTKCGGSVTPDTARYRFRPPEKP